MPLKIIKYEIIGRVKRSPWFDASDELLMSILNRLECAVDGNELTQYMHLFWDWADDHGVWVKIF